MPFADPTNAQPSATEGQASLPERQGLGSTKGADVTDMDLEASTSTVTTHLNLSTAPADGDAATGGQGKGQGQGRSGDAEETGSNADLDFAVSAASEIFDSDGDICTHTLLPFMGVLERVMATAVSKQW